MEKSSKGEKKENIESEIVKGESKVSLFFKSHVFKILLVILIFSALVFAVIYIFNSQNTIYTDNAEISAPIIALSPSTPGIIQDVFVKAGDEIPAGTTVAQVSGIPIKSQISGLVVSVQNTPGELANSQTPVVQMIDPQKLRLVGKVDENKGLVNIHPGQEVVFTLDAYGSEKFYGTVESVAPAPNTQDIVFSISNAREEQQYDVTIKYSLFQYPYFKEGMSARVWIQK